MKFTEDLKQAWIKKHSEVKVGMSELHSGTGCLCALGSFLDVLSDRGLVKWELVPSGSFYKARMASEEDGTVLQDYEILYSFPLLAEKVINIHDETSVERVYEIYRLNDRVFRKDGAEASRAAILEYINNLPVEE